jgi:hypothetical protein
MANKKVLLGLTTTQRSSWKKKAEEIKKYNIKEISLFLTGIEKKERQELYELLKEIRGLDIFHVHLRGDMERDELDYLAGKYSVKAFNIHPEKNKYSHPYYIEKYADIVYVENVETAPTETELKKYGGLCIDFSHWEDYTLQKNEKYAKEMEKLLLKYKIGCCHVSGVTEKPHVNEDKTIQGIDEYSTHLIKNLSEVDYIKKYKNYLPDIISIELENSFKEQLGVKKYLENLVSRI